ncbi:MAG: DNA primase [Desulfovibrio sp.]|nr:DNA primase [Desulfovibrio sp.]
MNSSEAIKAIKERLNIADIVSRHVQLRRNGSRLTAPCPFHQETKPSFSVDPDKGFFYCFGCHASGDIFEFYSKINGLDFNETLHALAEEAGIVIDSFSPEARAERKRELTKRQLILRMYEYAKRSFLANLESPAGAECREYIATRGLSEEIVAKFELGWAKREWRALAQGLVNTGYSEELAQEGGLLGKSDSGRIYDRFRGRLIFPIKNLSGQIIAFGGRIIAGEDEAKYINSPESPIYQKREHLYGLPQARAGITAKGFVFITEGYMDILTLHQFGYDNCVGVLGTALTEEQIKRISGFASSVVLLFDGDRAGRKAALRSSEMALVRGLKCRVVILPEGEDIDSLLRDKGPEFFDGLTRDAPEALDFCANLLRSLSPREGIDWAKGLLGKIEDAALASLYATRLASLFQINEEVLRKEALKQSGAKASRTIADLKNRRDTEILYFAARYPEKLDDLRAIGADLALTSPRARQYWDILEKYDVDEVVSRLDEKQKSFWFSCRGPEAPPLDTCDFEFSCLEKSLKDYYDAAEKASIKAALESASAPGEFEAQLDYLRALQETMEKGREQS